MWHEKDSTHRDAFEDGGKRPWAKEVVASRGWESPSVYNQQENMDLSLKLQGAEFFNTKSKKWILLYNFQKGTQPSSFLTLAL